MTVELLEMMLFVTSARCWRNLTADATPSYSAIGVRHPFVQLDAASAPTPGEALLAAYTAWKDLSAAYPPTGR